MPLRRRAFVLSAVAMVLLLAAAAPPAQAQCAMCRAALTGSPEGRHIARQFNAAILVMVFAPYAVVATLAGVLFRRQLRELLVRRLPHWPWAARLRARWPVLSWRR